MGNVLGQPELHRHAGYKVASADVLYGDDGSPVTVCTLPAGAIIERVDRYVSETFDDSGTDTLIVGHATDDNHFVETGDTDLTATGFTSAVTPTVTPYYCAAETAVLAQYDGQNGNATQGRVVVMVYYSQPKLS